MLAKAWRLPDADPVPEVTKLQPKATVDEAQAACWHASLSGPWAKHAGIY